MNQTLVGELTHVATVQTWECDSNNHMNVQFFHQRFREAGYLFRQQYGLKGTAMASAHTRFYRELHADDTGRILTVPVRDNTGTLFLMHQLTVDGSTLCCVTLDQLSDDKPGLPARPLADFPQAGPRGLDAGRVKTAKDTQAMVVDGIADVTCITHLLPSDMDHVDDWRAERVVSSFSNGGQSAWAIVGATTPWLREHNLGRVVLEMKYDRFAYPDPGTVLRQTSYPVALKGKTYRFRHQIEDALSGKVCATGEVLSVLMDLSARKVVPLSPALKLPGTR